MKAEHELESDNLTVSPRNDLIKFNDKSAHINMNIPESFNKDGEGVPLPSSSSSSAPVINASNAMPDNGAAEDLHDLDGNFLLAAASALTALEKSDISPKHSHPVISPENNVVTTNDRVVMSQGEDGNSGLTLSLSSPEISPLKHAAASSSSSSSSPLKQSKTPHTPSRIVNDTQTIINNNHNTCIPIASPSNHSKRLQQQSLRTRHPSPYRLDTTIESIVSNPLPGLFQVVLI